jgi:hypothetical protein
MLKQVASVQDPEAKRKNRLEAIAVPAKAGFEHLLKQ